MLILRRAARIPLLAAVVLMAACGTSGSEAPTTGPTPAGQSAPKSAPSQNFDDRSEELAKAISARQTVEAEGDARVGHPIGDPDGIAPTPTLVPNIIPESPLLDGQLSSYFAEQLKAGPSKIFPQ